MATELGSCPLCGADRGYSEEYDSIFCLSCDKWLESSCEDPGCEFCSSRPVKPSDYGEVKNRRLWWDTNGGGIIIKNKLLQSKYCGCFHCIEIFEPGQIERWNKSAAVCPHCGIEAVIGDSTGYTITKEFLKMMNSIVAEQRF